MEKLKEFLQPYWLYLFPIILAVVLGYDLVYDLVEDIEIPEKLSLLSPVLVALCSTVLFALCSFEWLPWFHKDIHRRLAPFACALLLLCYTTAKNYREQTKYSVN